MEPVVVPHFEINFHVLSWQNAQAVHVHVIEKRRTGLLGVERYRLNKAFLNGLFDLAIECQAAESVIIGNNTREIDVGRKLFVERFNTNVRIGVGYYIHREGQGVNGMVPAVLNPNLKFGGLCGDKLVFKHIIFRHQRVAHSITGHSHLFRVACREAES